MRLDGTPKEIVVSDGLPSTVTAMSWQGDEIYGTGTWPGKSTTTRMTLLDHNHYKHEASCAPTGGRRITVSRSYKRQS